MVNLSLYLWIALGGALGSMLRFGAASAVAAWLGEAFPWGTLMVNVVGSFVIGFFASYIVVDGKLTVGPAGRHFFMTGVLGGFTTFSSFSLQTLSLAREGEWLKAGVNVGASVGLCLFSVWLGYATAMALRSRTA
jgi:CrcB protein